MPEQERLVIMLCMLSCNRGGGGVDQAMIWWSSATMIAGDKAGNFHSKEIHLSNTGKGPQGIPILEHVPVVQVEPELPLRGLFFFLMVIFDVK